jgi:hypothetical protein
MVDCFKSEAFVGKAKYVTRLAKLGELLKKYSWSLPSRLAFLLVTGFASSKAANSNTPILRLAACNAVRLLQLSFLSA